MKKYLKSAQIEITNITLKTLSLCPFKMDIIIYIFCMYKTYIHANTMCSSPMKSSTPYHHHYSVLQLAHIWLWSKVNYLVGHGASLESCLQSQHIATGPENTVKHCTSHIATIYFLCSSHLHNHLFWNLPAGRQYS